MSLGRKVYANTPDFMNEGPFRVGLGPGLHHFPHHQTHTRVDYMSVRVHVCTSFGGLGRGYPCSLYVCVWVPVCVTWGIWRCMCLCVPVCTWGVYVSVCVSRGTPGGVGVCAYLVFVYGVVCIGCVFLCVSGGVVCICVRVCICMCVWGCVYLCMCVSVCL